MPRISVWDLIVSFHQAFLLYFNYFCCSLEEKKYISGKEVQLVGPVYDESVQYQGEKRESLF